MALVIQFDWEVEQMDVKTTFLYVELKEEIYIKQPEGFECWKNSNKIHSRRRNFNIYIYIYILKLKQDPNS